MKKRNLKNSLFIKISFISLLCVFIPLLINLFYSTYSSSKALESEAKSSLTTLTEEKNRQVDLVFYLQSQISESMVNELYIVEFFQELASSGTVSDTERENIANSLGERLLNSNGLYENIFFSYGGEVFIDGIGGNSVGHVFDKEVESYYYEQLENPGMTTADYMYSPITGRPVIPIVNSIVDEETNEVLSVFVIAVDVNRLTDEVVHANEGQSVNTMVLDLSGLVIASSQPDQALTLNFSEVQGISPFYEQMLAEDKGEGMFTLMGSENIASYGKNEDYGVFVVTYMPVEQFLGKLDDLKSGIVTVIVISMILASVIIILNVRTIVKPIKLVSHSAQQIAAGNLKTPSLQIKNNDEVGELAHSFNVMLRNLQTMVEQLNLTSEKVASSAEEFSATSEQSSQISKQVAEAIQQVAAGAQNQSAHVGTSSDMVQEVTKGLNQVTDNTQNVATSALLTTEKANKGAATIDQSISEIEAVNQNIHDVASKIEKLGDRSKEIGQIVGVITQIAEQTNLLALNAAIEAARAGEHGRGFAVVANEVRKLAEQSKGSSDQIRELIETILQETNETIVSMGETVEQSSKGISAIRSVEQTFDDIQQSVNAVTNQIQSVSAATKQMNDAINHIVSNINEISDISTETASKTQQVSSAMEEQLASAEEIAVSSNSMAKLAEELQNVVNKFKV
ncbi:methyl-accepting chemotaxis protein [Alkalihalobacterium bogoriense]|uniref:methyl-accepting chemotaxis protein n=1 Tax=Alkalihalobacterium bogoriense TaxID=246272 RepID=UPI0006882831|nr:methyl-accepting chemotaxis protein [Alkalihalobacterium bogoriense]